MAASKPFAPVGLKLGYKADEATADYTYLGQITSLSGPSQSKETIDVTSFDSQGGYREFIAGFRDGGEITCDMNFTSSSFRETQTLFDANTESYWVIELPNIEGTEVTFKAELTSNQMSASVGDKVSASITLKVSGKVTITDTVVP